MNGSSYSAVSRILDQDMTTITTTPGVNEDMYRPTLVIGIGGTGTLVIKRLKRLIRERFGERHSELFQFLAIDTEAETIGSQRLEVHEFLNMAETNILATNLVQAMMRDDTAEIYSSLREWWPMSGDKPFLPGDIVSGAKATRCIGRMALWCRGLDVYSAIRSKLKTALQIRGLRRSDVPATGNAAKAFIVSSLAGGTGSGMYLDIAYMVREAIRQEAMTSFVTGLLVADTEPFTSLIGEEGLLRRMNANVYAALCELDWFMGGNQHPRQRHNTKQPASHYELRYLNQLHIRSDARPFDVSYLVTSTNEHGRRLRDITDLTEMIAQEVFLEIATPLGRTGRSQLDNVDRLSAFSDYGSRPMAYSGFAVSSLNLTTELLSRQCARTISRRILEQLTAMNGSTPIQLPVQVQEHLAEVALTTDQAINKLQSFFVQQPKQRLPRMEYALGIESDQYLAEATDLLSKVQARLDKEIRADYRGVEERISEAYQRAFDHLIMTVLSSNRISLAQATQVISTWLQTAEATHSEIKAEMEATQKDAVQRYQQLTEQFDMLKQELNTPTRRLLVFSTGKEERVASTASAILELLSGWAACQLDYLQWNALSKVFENIERILRRYRDQLGRLRNLLTQTLEKIVEAQQKAKGRLDEGSKQYQLEFEVLSMADVEVLATHIEQQLESTLVAQGVMDDLVHMSITPNKVIAWGDGIISYVERQVQGWLRTHGLFEVLLHIHEHNPAGIERQLKKLIEYAAPFWNLTLTNCPEATQWSTLSLIGYAGASDTDETGALRNALRQVMGRFTTVDITESNRIVLLNTKHGVPLFALAAANGMMRSSYYNYRQGWNESRPGYKPIHISKCWSDMDDFNPAEPPS